MVVKYKEVKILKGDFWGETYKIKTKLGMILPERCH